MQNDIIRRMQSVVDRNGHVIALMEKAEREGVMEPLTKEEWKRNREAQATVKRALAELMYAEERFNILRNLYAQVCAERKGFDNLPWNR